MNSKTQRAARTFFLAAVILSLAAFGAAQKQPPAEKPSADAPVAAVTDFWKYSLEWKKDDIERITTEMPADFWRKINITPAECRAGRKKIADIEILKPSPAQRSEEHLKTIDLVRGIYTLQINTTKPVLKILNSRTAGGEAVVEAEGSYPDDPTVWRGHFFLVRENDRWKIFETTIFYAVREKFEPQGFADPDCERFFAGQK